MNKVEEAFTDDLTGFLPFTPIAHTGKDEFAGILTIEQNKNFVQLSGG